MCTVEQSATFPTFFPSKTVIICRRLEARTTATRRHQAQAGVRQRSLSRQLFPVRFTFARIAMNAVIWEVMVLWQYSPHRPTSGLTSNSAFLDNYFLCQFTFFLYLDSSSHILILILISSWFVSPFPSVFPMQRRILNHYDITFVLFMASRGNPQ